MELVLSISFGIWFLIGAIFYGFITKIDHKKKLMSPKLEGEKR